MASGREEHGLSIDHVAEQMVWHPTKLSRAETGRRAIAPSDVRALLSIYDITGAPSDRLMALAREARQKGWWQAYGEAIPDWFESYVGLESEASSLRLYESEFVPGLLQTDDYARAVHHAAQINATDDEIEKLVAVRRARQELLASDDAPHLWVVVNEAVVRRTVGGTKVMRAQLQRLVDAAAEPKVTLQVLPFSVGAHPAMGGGFHVLSFDQEDPDVVYIEYQTGVIYLERQDEVQRYTLMFDHLRASAMPVKTSRSLIARLALELEE
jgi:transcriptional regulator with XRE-family HTH domain